MGFAKYQEDIASRYVNDNRDKQKVQARPVQKSLKKITQSLRRKNPWH